MILLVTFKIKIENDYKSLSSVLSKYFLIVVIAASVLGEEIKNENSVYEKGYKITYDGKVEAIIRMQPIGRSVPVTMMDLTADVFLYVTEKECYLGSIRTPVDGSSSKRNVWTAIQNAIREDKIFLAMTKLETKQVKTRLRSNLGNECQNRSIWLVSETKPKSTPFQHFRKGFQKNRTQPIVGLQKKKGSRTRREINPYYFYEKQAYPHIQMNTRHQINPYYQSDDTSSDNVRTIKNIPYLSNIFNARSERDPSFRHYQEFNHENFNHDLENKNGRNYNHPSVRYDQNKNIISSSENFVTSNPSPEQKDFKFPDKIVKDGMVFYRHDVKEQNNQSGITGMIPTQKESQTIEIQNGAARSEPTITKDFDFLLDHIRHIGAQKPLISAAIAGAAIRGSSKGSSSHVIGSAINGGYFAASAQGYDGKGGSIHSHVHGTGEKVSGGASAIAPDRDGEAFIQVDNSERGLSIGQSSTHNGEAFVIADVDRESEHLLQHGDSTSSYSDNYNTKRIGHTFGEAKSKIQGTAKANNKNSGHQKQNSMNVKKQNSKNVKNHSEEKAKPIGMGLIDNIMEEVHQPRVVTSMLSQNGDTDFEDYIKTGHKYQADDILISNVPKYDDTKNNKLNVNSKTQEKGAVGLVTYPYGQVGAPPGPGELLTQAPDTVFLPLLNKFDEDYFVDFPFTKSKFNNYDYDNNYLEELYANKEHDNKQQYSGNGKSLFSNVDDKNKNFEVEQPSYYNDKELFHSEIPLISSRRNVNLHNNLDDQNVSHEKDVHTTHQSKDFISHQILTKDDHKYSNKKINFEDKSFEGRSVINKNYVDRKLPYHPSNMDHSSKENQIYTDTQDHQTYSNYDLVSHKDSTPRSNDYKKSYFPEPGVTPFPTDERYATNYAIKQPDDSKDTGNNYYNPEHSVYQPYSSISLAKNPVDDDSKFGLQFYPPRESLERNSISNDQEHKYIEEHQMNSQHTIPQSQFGDTLNINSYPQLPHQPQPHNNQETLNKRHPSYYNNQPNLPSIPMTESPYNDDYDYYDSGYGTQNLYIQSTTDTKSSNNNKNNIHEPDPGDSLYSYPLTDQVEHSSYTTHPSVIYNTDNPNIDGHQYSPDLERSETREASSSAPVSQPSFNNYDRKSSSEVSHPRTEIQYNENVSPAFASAADRQTPRIEMEEKMISRSALGVTQQLVPAEPGQPQVNIVVMDKNDKRKQFYQREGTPIGPGERIPGAPGYRVPSGFRGRVVYGHKLPVEIESRKTVKGYNTRITVRPQTPSNGLLFASVSGPEAASNFIPSPNTGVHITLSSPNTGNVFPKAAQTQQYRSIQNPRERNPSHGRSSQITPPRPNISNQLTNPKSGNVLQASNGQCGYYKNVCQTMNGPYSAPLLCVPKFIVVACCC